MLERSLGFFRAETWVVQYLYVPLNNLQVSDGSNKYFPQFFQKAHYRLQYCWLEYSG